MVRRRGLAASSGRSPRPLPRWSLRSQRPHLLGRLVARDADAMIQAPASRSAHPRRPRSSASGPPAPPRRSRPSPRRSCFGLSIVLFAAVMVTVPVLSVWPAVSVSVVPASVKSASVAGGVRRRRNGHRHLRALDGPLSVAVTRADAAVLVDRHMIEHERHHRQCLVVAGS